MNTKWVAIVAATTLMLAASLNQTAMAQRGGRGGRGGGGWSGGNNNVGNSGELVVATTVRTIFPVRTRMVLSISLSIADRIPIDQIEIGVTATIVTPIDSHDLRGIVTVVRAIATLPIARGKTLVASIDMIFRSATVGGTHMVSLATQSTVPGVTRAGAIARIIGGVGARRVASPTGSCTASLSRLTGTTDQTETSGMTMAMSTTTVAAGTLQTITTIT